MNTNKRRMMMMSERDQHPPEKKQKNRLPVFRDGGEFVFCFFCFIFSRKAQADEAGLIINTLKNLRNASENKRRARPFNLRKKKAWLPQGLFTFSKSSMT
jgi:hypothetical protein